HFVAAEKRDYAEHSAFRQQFLQNFFLPVSAASLRNPNPLPPRNPCRCCVCSAFRVARGRILDDHTAEGKRFRKRIYLSIRIAA
ncbi:hypothetical protein, partial [Cupriavidus sp. SHE]